MRRLIDQPLLPGAMLGVLGGGQLGRMFAQSAMQMGYRVTVLDPAATGPAAEVASSHIQCGFDDIEGLTQLAQNCAAVTTEFENVPAASLRFLQRYVPVSPSPEAVEIAQNRNREKRFFKTHDLPTNTFEKLTDDAQIPAAFAKMNGRAVLKTAQLGYDGKGQRVCDSVDDVAEGFVQFGRVECALEDFVPFDTEISVVLARDVNAVVETFSVSENQHCNGILDISIVPARIAPSVESNAIALAVKLANALDYVGVLAVEMFVAGDQLLINEIAPRPHNSGHYSIDAANYSQFDQQVRVLCGLPAAQIALHSNTVMLNVLGDLLLVDGFDWAEIIQQANTHVHCYGKSESRLGRKMGHINFLGTHTDALLDNVAQLKMRWPSAFDE